MKTIPIPHLNYTVGFTNKEHKERPNPCCERLDKSRCNIYIPCKNLSVVNAPTVAHEVMHALQFIAQDRELDMISEQEHMGYLMQYIMREIYDLVAVTLK